jgi:predicted acetyltransferase
MSQSLALVWPAREYLPGYVSALERGWTPDNTRGEPAAHEERAWIMADPDGFLASQVDRAAAGPPIVLPDGTVVARLPGINRWLWDGDFCGRISFRWQPGTEALPAHCLGHIGYTVVPWKQRRGYATRALGEMLGDARAAGLRYVEITTDPANVASQRVIAANGGALVEEFIAPASLGGQRKLRYRIVFTRDVRGPR